MALAVTDRFLLDAYSGGGGFLDGRYLIRHPRESDEKFRRRKELAVYPNYVRKVTDTYLGFLWRRLPKREGSELYSRFQQNADGRGTDLDSVLLNAQRLALLLGVVFLVVDREATVARTRAEEPLPYLALRLPSQVVRYQQDPQGRLIEITFQETDGERLLYRTYGRDGWRLEERGRVIESGRYRLGRVPVVPLYAAPPLEPHGLLSTSSIRDIALLNWDLYNLYSELRELFRAQVFSILALPVSAPEDRERLRDLTVSTENALLYDPTGGGKPDFIAPPEGPVKLYMEQISGLIEQIYKLAGLEFVGGVQASGVALGFHFQQANAQFIQMADLCERAEKEVAELVHAWMGAQWEGYISYPRDFNLYDLQKELQLALDAVTLSLGPAFERALKKRLARQILGDEVSPREMEEILREIEAGGDEYGDRIRRRVNSRA